MQQVSTENYNWEENELSFSAKTETKISEYF